MQPQKTESTPGLEHGSKATSPLWGCSLRILHPQTSHDTVSSRHPAVVGPSCNFSACYSQHHCQCLHMGYHQCFIWPGALVYYTVTMCFSAARSSSVLVYFTCSWSEQTSWTSTFTATIITKACFVRSGFYESLKASRWPDSFVSWQQILYIHTYLKQFSNQYFHRNSGSNDCVMRRCHLKWQITTQLQFPPTRSLGIMFTCTKYSGFCLYSKRDNMTTKLFTCLMKLHIPLISPCTCSSACSA